MKNTGFTLAEVLIVLAIIGVVAAITIPAVLSSTQGKEHSTASNKALTTLNGALSMRFAIEDGESMDDYAGSITDYLTQKIDNGANTNKVALAGAEVQSGCSTSNACKVTTKDGMIWLFPSGAASDTGTNQCSSTNGCLVWVDTNGGRGPSRNNMSGKVMNCASGGQATSTIDDGTRMTNKCPDIIALRIVDRDASAADQRTKNIMMTGHANQSQ